MRLPDFSEDFWLRPHRRVGAALVVLAAVLVVSFARRPGDFAGYLLVGELALQHRHIYHDAPPVVSTWPPFFSLVCIPLALAARVSLVGARAAWLALNFAGLAGVLALVARVVARGPDGARDVPVPPLTSAAVLVPLLLTARYVSSNFEHLQINVLVFLLTLGGLALVAAGRDVAGGLAIGVAAALKVMPVLFVPWFVWRGRWRAALWTLAWAAVCSLSPGLVYGWSRLLDYFAAWREALRVGWPVGKMNQSVYAMWDRILGHGMVPFTVGQINELPASHDPRVMAALLLSLAAVAAVALWAFRPTGRIGPRAELAEWCAVFLVASLFGTVMWAAYLIVLLPANALLLDVWRAPRVDAATRRGAARVVGASFVLGVATTSGLLGTELAGRLEMGSVVTAASLVMLGGLFWLRRRSGATDAAVAGA
jgi:alpha-1,2-mannosyltransferase